MKKKKKKKKKKKLATVEILQDRIISHPERK